MMNVTLDGWDPDAQLTIPLINVWRSCSQRELGVAITLPHGTSVELLEHKGRRVKIRHGDATGYVTDYFIREFK